MDHVAIQILFIEINAHYVRPHHTIYIYSIFFFNFYFLIFIFKILFIYLFIYLFIFIQSIRPQEVPRNSWEMWRVDSNYKAKPKLQSNLAFFFLLAIYSQNTILKN